MSNANANDQNPAVVSQDENANTVRNRGMRRQGRRERQRPRAGRDSQSEGAAPNFDESERQQVAMLMSDFLSLPAGIPSTHASVARVRQGRQRIESSTGPRPPRYLPRSQRPPIVAEAAGTAIPTPAVAEVAKPRMRSLAMWLKTLEAPVSEASTDAIAWAERYGIWVKPTKTPVKKHPVSALCRFAATQALLIKEASRVGGTAMSVLDVFGSARTRAFCPQLSNRKEPTTTYSTTGNKLKELTSDKAYSIDLVAAPDTPVQGDMSRGMNVRVSFPNRKFDVVMLVDIYQCGNYWQQEFSPDFAKRLIDMSKTGKIYWIGRFFSGMAGADVFDGCESEQAFYRDEEGYIISRPDNVTDPYPRHPFPEWLRQRQHEGLDLTNSTSYGPYFQVCITRSRPLSIPIPKIDISHSNIVVQYSIAETQTTKFLNRAIYSKTVFKQVWGHRRTVATRVAGITDRLVNGNVMDSANIIAAKGLDEDPQMKAVKDYFPDVYAKILRGTTAALIYFERVENARANYSRRAAINASDRLLKEARGQNFDSSSMDSARVLGLKVLGGALALGACYVSYKVSKGQPLKVKAAVAGVAGLASLFVAQKCGAPVLTTGALVETHPVTSAALEEGAAFVLPPIAFAVGAFECLREYKRDGKIPVRKFALHASLYALRQSALGPVGAFLAHIGWNHFQQKTFARYNEFASAYSRGELLSDVVPQTCPIPAGAFLPAYTSTVTTPPEHFRGTIHVKVDGTPVTIEEAFSLLDDSLHSNVTYPLLVTQRLLHQPANNEINLLVAVLHRLHNDPFYGNPNSAEVRYANWDLLATFVLPLLPVGRTAFITNEENVVLMGKKGARIGRALQDDLFGISTFNGKTVNLKWNETISACKSFNGVVSMKPRAIQNLPALTHGLMGGQAREFADELHRVFDGKSHSIFGYPVRIFFASGFNQAKLTEIGNAMNDGYCVFAMSGDDSVVSWAYMADRGMDLFGEADQSKFDHTQDEGPMVHYMGPILRQMQFSEEFIAMAYKACSSSYTLRRGRLTAWGTAGTQMPTGITTTTTFNSMSTLGFFIWSVYRWKVLGLGFSPLLAGQEIGFDVKYASSNNLSGVTFLKGWWLRGENGVQWVPLPSAVLKLGKLLKNPLEITRFTRRGKKMWRPYQQAVEMCGHALASSYGTLDPTYPILGAFCGVLKRKDHEGASGLGSLQESWKPVMTGISVDREAALDAIYERYGLTQDEVLEVEELIVSVRSLPAYVEHPSFDALCNKDY